MIKRRTVLKSIACIALIGMQAEASGEDELMAHSPIFGYDFVATVLDVVCAPKLALSEYPLCLSMAFIPILNFRINDIVVSNAGNRATPITRHFVYMSVLIEGGAVRRII